MLSVRELLLPTARREDRGELAHQPGRVESTIVLERRELSDLVFFEQRARAPDRPEYSHAVLDCAGAVRR